MSGEDISLGGPGTATEHLGAELAGASLTVARRFAAGATMWCAAPQWPWHARHLAVELLHPVIVGKRALPALTTSGEDPAREVRLLSRPGDLLVTLGSGDHPVVGDLLRRSPAWGLTRIAIGAGPRPTANQAEHTVWLEDIEPSMAARSGDLVLCYHLLWELTHVVLEHPGLLDIPVEGVGSGEADDAIGGYCRTCRDEAALGEVVEHGPGDELQVVVNGRRETVEASLLDRVEPGDLVLVHAGVAISRLPDRMQAAGS